MATPLESAQLVGGRFRLLREIGRGAAGAVWHVRNETTERDFAMKVLHAGTEHDPRALRRFVNEARAAGRLRHRNVVEVYDTGLLEDGTPYQVMQLLEGESLGARLRREGPLDVRDALLVIRDVARGLAAAHARGVVHRDVKPENVFLSTVDSAPVVKLLDFGVSKLEEGAGDPLATRQGALIGSPAYMSPEQIECAGRVDARTDVWAVGVLLYRCLAGRVPFPQRGLRELAMAIATSEPPPLPGLRDGVPASVVAIVERCLAKTPDARFSSSALVSALTAALESLARSDAPPSRRQPARALVASFVALALVTSAVIGWAARNPASSQDRVASPPSPPELMLAPDLVAPPFATPAPPSVARPKAPEVRAGAPRARARRPNHEGVIEPGF